MTEGLKTTNALVIKTIDDLLPSAVRVEITSQIAAEETAEVVSAAGTIHPAIEATIEVAIAMEMIQDPLQDLDTTKAGEEATLTEVDATNEALELTIGQTEISISTLLAVVREILYLTIEITQGIMQETTREAAHVIETITEEILLLTGVAETMIENLHQEVRDE